MSKCISSINHIFTKKVLNELLDTGTSDVYDYVIQRFTTDAESKTNGELISEIYVRLADEYRNEYYYINTLLNKLLIGIHSVNTTTALSQVRIADHIADFVMINGEGCVYEIKSDLDNLDRLTEQIKDYYKAFSKVSVLAAENEFEHVKHMLSRLGETGDYVGLYVLSNNDTIFNHSISREPQLWNENLNHKCLFNLLRKREYESVLLSYFGIVPTVAPVFYYKACLEQFSEIPILIAQQLVFKELKNRNRISMSTFKSIPKELRSVFYFSDLQKKLPQLAVFLQRPYQGR